MTRTYARNRIRELRKARGFTQEMVAERLGGTTAKGTIAKLETGSMALSLDYIQSIARVLGVSPAEIIADDAAPGARLIPIMGLVAAGSWRDALADPHETVAIPPYVRGGNVFALRIEGDSMDMVMADGGIVVVDPDQRELIAGRIYVVANGDHATTIKRFELNPPRLVPLSTNPEHQPIVIGDEPFIVLARAVYSINPL